MGWRFSRTWLNPVVLGLLLAGCATPTEWVRPSTTTAQRDIDQRECSQLAFREAQDNYWWRQHLYLDYPWPYGGPYYSYRLQSLDMDAMMEEARLRDFCMRARGYQLQRIPQARPG